VPIGAVELKLEHVRAGAALDLPEHERGDGDQKKTRGPGHGSAGGSGEGEEGTSREGNGVVFTVRAEGCKDDVVVRLAPVALPMRAGAGSRAAAARIVSVASGAEAARVSSRDGIAIRVPEALRNAAPRRLASFLAGRYCARRALLLAGCEGGEVGMGADRAPVWPAGFVGSITHADRLVAAVAASRRDVRAIGIDCEALIDAHTADEIAPKLLTMLDRVTFARDVAGHLGWREFVSLAFSAKESLYKCLNPVTGVFFEFADAGIASVDLSGRRLVLRLARSLDAEFACGAELCASFTIADGHVRTAVELPDGRRAGGEAVPGDAVPTTCAGARSVS
jgi:4'-phosphopantetheinyl transferase EntD